MVIVTVIESKLGKRSVPASWSIAVTELSMFWRMTVLAEKPLSAQSLKNCHGIWKTMLKAVQTKVVWLVLYQREV